MKKIILIFNFENFKHCSDLSMVMILDKLLDQLPTPTERLSYKQKLTPHYATMAEKTYDILEFFSEHIANEEA